MSLRVTRPSTSRGQRAPELTREQIARDLAAFRRSGGRIERLGATRVLTRVDEAATNVPRPAATPARMRG